MKLKIGCVLAALGIILAVMGTANAVSLKPGPLVFKTFNWEVGIGYDGTIGKTYFRSAATPGYDAMNPNHLLFTDASFSAFPTGAGLLPDEDTFGLFEVTQLWDGTVTGGGTDIASGVKYWDKGDNSEYLRGMFWGGQDQRVFIGDDGLGGKTITVYSTGLQWNLYEMPADYAMSPQVDPAMEPGDRDGMDYFTGWRGNGEGILQAEGAASFFRFIGETSAGAVNGQTLVYLDVTNGAWEGQPNVLMDFWNVPTIPALGGLFNDDAPTDLKQTWTILSEAGPWTKSEDVGKGFVVVPEPVTMMAFFLGVSSLVGYSRKRFA